MMLFRSLFIIGTQASLFALSGLPSTVFASPVPMPIPQPQNWLHVMVADIPSSLLPTTTEGVTIQRPSGTDPGNTDIVLATSAPAEASATNSAPDSISTDTGSGSTSPPQTNGALSTLASNKGAMLGASALALAFLAL